MNKNRFNIVPTLRFESDTIYDFSEVYEECLADMDVRRCGFAKIYIDNREVPNPTMTEKIPDLEIEVRKQTFEANETSGVFYMTATPCKRRTYKSFKDVVENENGKNSPLSGVKNPFEFIKEYWSNMVPTKRQLKDERIERYAYEWKATTLFDARIKKLNLSNLGNVLDETKTQQICFGINTTMILVGGAETSFPWHTEDEDLASINYHHDGDDKYWVLVWPESRKDFEEAAKRDFANFEDKQCSNPLKHKRYFTDLEWLKNNDIHFSVVIQEAGSYIIVLPGVYHSGYNKGLNLTEARNFMCRLWAIAQKNHIPCDCCKNKHVKHKHSLNLDQFKHSGPLVCQKETVVSIIDVSSCETVEADAIVEAVAKQNETETAENFETEVNGVNVLSKSKESDESPSSRIPQIGYEELDRPVEAGRYLMTVDKNPDSGESEIIDLVKVSLLDTMPKTFFFETNEEHFEKEAVIEETVTDRAVIDETNKEYFDIEMLDEEEPVDYGAYNEMNINFTENHMINRKNRGGRPAHGPQVCDFPNCEKTFKTKCRLDEHKLTHGPKNFVCIECDKRYHTQKLLNEHFRDSKKHKKDSTE